MNMNSNSNSNNKDRMRRNSKPEDLVKRTNNHVDPHQVSDIVRSTLVLILAGGQGARLHELTEWRAKPAVHFGGKYRIIDFALSNCVNSGLRRIGVLTQYRAHSLIRHLQRAWGFMRYEIDEFVEILPAQQRTSRKHWYQGTADALYQNVDIIRRHQPSYVVVLGGDHIYSMDYTKMLIHHVAHKADFTVGCIEVNKEDAREFGVMSIDENMKISKFCEKPETPECMPDNPDLALVSMGIYVFSTEVLYKILDLDADSQTSSHDFGKDIVPANIESHNVIAYPFRDEEGKPKYWRDVGNVDTYWKANMELCGMEPELNLYSRDWPIWTYQTQLPPAKFIFDDEGCRGEAIDSLISGGCILSGATVKRSVVFFAVTMNCFSVIKDSVILPKVSIGKHCRITRTIIEKGCDIPDGTVIGEDRDEDDEKFYVSKEGIVLVTKKMLGQEVFSATDPLTD